MEENLVAKRNRDGGRIAAEMGKGSLGHKPFQEMWPWIPKPQYSRCPQSYWETNLRYSRFDHCNKSNLTQDRIVNQVADLTCFIQNLAGLQKEQKKCSILFSSWIVSTKKIIWGNGLENVYWDILSVARSTVVRVRPRLWARRRSWESCTTATLPGLHIIIVGVLMHSK